MKGGALPKTGLSHDELAADLAAYLRGSGNRITWENLQLGESGSPRPDVYTMEKTYTRQSFEVFEVKVSVADFRSDVTSGKWQSYLPFANCVTFATPAGLISKADVPASCGLIQRQGSVWRYAKRPVRQIMRDLPWQAWVKLLLDGTERATFDRRRDHFSTYLAARKLAAKFGEDVATMVGDIQRLPERMKFQQELFDKQQAEQEKQRVEARERFKQQQEDERERCTNELARLAVALGLPADATLRDLRGAAGAILNVIETGRHRFSRDDLGELAKRLEETAANVRKVDAMLGYTSEEQGAAA